MNLKKPIEQPEPNKPIVANRSAYLVCDNCGGYPMEPRHGHYVCPSCHLPTKCCEGAPAD